MTDGMLFRETLIDPLLSRYSVIMVSDEKNSTAVFSQFVSRLTRLTNEVSTQTYY